MSRMAGGSRPVSSSNGPVPGAAAAPRMRLAIAVTVMAMNQLPINVRVAYSFNVACLLFLRQDAAACVRSRGTNSTVEERVETAFAGARPRSCAEIESTCALQSVPKWARRRAPEMGALAIAGWLSEVGRTSTIAEFARARIINAECSRRRDDSPAVSRNTRPCRELDTMSRMSEPVRVYGWEKVVTTTLADLRYGARRLRREPGLHGDHRPDAGDRHRRDDWRSSGAVQPILFEPLPYPEAERIMSVSRIPIGCRRVASRRHLRHVIGTSRIGARTLDAIAVFKPWKPTITDADQPERFAGQRVSAAYFHVLGVRRSGSGLRVRPTIACAGRTSSMLSDALWRRRFAGRSGDRRTRRSRSMTTSISSSA